MTPVRLQEWCRVCLRRMLLTACLFYTPLLKVVLASIWLLGVIIAAVPLMNEGVFGNYYGHNGVCFPLHSDRQEKPTAKGYSTGVFLGKFKTKDSATACFLALKVAIIIHLTGGKIISSVLLLSDHLDLFMYVKSFSAQMCGKQI